MTLCPTPRPEHPQPQFKRAAYEILNGKWQFEPDNSLSALKKGILEKEKLDLEINVPFCPESTLSGIGNTDFMYSVWYRRSFTPAPHGKDSRVVLHFGAVDYKATVYLNGREVGVHKGGFSPFSFDITDFLNGGENVIDLHAEDYTGTSERIPAGKQSYPYASAGCHYTRTTGIWQTVWVEYLPETHIKNFKFYTDIVNGTVTVKTDLRGAGTLRTEISYEGRPMAASSVEASGSVCQTFKLAELHLWEPGHGRLYDVKFTFAADEVTSYFGMRSTEVCGRKYLFNKKPFFLRTVLDQGYYPDGIMTAPSERALINDIELSMAAGFNGARLHQKVFEPLFLYHCDRLGYLVWGEFPSWGMVYSDPKDYLRFMPEWLDILERDFNHPSVIGWCPLNEAWHDPDPDVIVQICRATKIYDTTRPCIDVSGGYDTAEGDMYDIHDYNQDPAAFAVTFAPDPDNIPENRYVKRAFYRGQPIFVSEYGGIAWKKDANAPGWGYGVAPKTKEEYVARYEALTAVLLKNPYIAGFCYTQLYDIEQEINGVYTYSRELKFSDDEMARIKAANTAPAAAEN